MASLASSLLADQPADPQDDPRPAEGDGEPADGAGDTADGAGDPADGRPTYKGEPLDAARGPGLGCFWIQVILLVSFLILTPVSVWLAAPEWVSAALLLMTLGLLFFVGQTSI